jgi:outer membrane protein, heavy metal efflux system
MLRLLWRSSIGILLSAACLAQAVNAPKTLTWQDAESEFRANNPALAAGKINIDESRADEITAYLRPNPNLNVTADDLGVFTYHPFQPTANAILAGSVDYLIERGHKRQLRLDSARGATAMAISGQNDLERNLIFNLRDAFVRVLLNKAVRDLAREDLDYYDKLIEISRVRMQSGAIAKVDLQRIELQRAQYESDLQTAEVNLRTAKLDLLQFLNDKTPVEQFDVNAPFDYQEHLTPLSELHDVALQNRPDLRQAQQALEKARVDHQLAIANGTADPTVSADVGRQPPLVFYSGFSVSVPLRIFDKNQGEKARTQLDITRNQRLRDSAETSVFHDVDSAYATVDSTLKLLQPYRATYLKEAADVRSTVSFSYEHGAASLLDFLDAQREYRSLRLSFLNLVGAYLSAANQLNLAVGREVIQ